MQIRDERPGDTAAIHALTRDAFEQAARTRRLRGDSPDADVCYHAAFDASA